MRLKFVREKSAFLLFFQSSTFHVVFVLPSCFTKTSLCSCGREMFLYEDSFLCLGAALCLCWSFIPLLTFICKVLEKDMFTLQVLMLHHMFSNRQCINSSVFLLLVCMVYLMYFWQLCCYDIRVLHCTVKIISYFFCIAS